MIGLLSPSKITILEACKTPQSYSALRAKLHISETAFLSHLTELKNKGLITKRDQGKYYITKEGIQTLRIIKVLERTKELAERSEADLSRIEKFLNF